MSGGPLHTVARGWEKMREVAKRLHGRTEQPFMALSFLALPVIPELKITGFSMGLIGNIWRDLNKKQGEGRVIP